MSGIGYLNECCKVEANRLPGPGPRGVEQEPPPEVTVTHCAVCECRHFEAALEPGALGVQGARL